jgi:hypothetical protein
MNFSDKSLLRKLALVLVLKLAILLALWWVFVRDQRVAVDDSGVAAQLLQPASLSTQGTNK